MSQVSESSKLPNKKNAGGSPVRVVPKPETVGVEEKGDLLTEVWLRFGRFGWDVLGVIIITCSVITLIGLLNPAWAQGFLLSRWVSLISWSFGWGWPVVVLAALVLGVLCLRRRYKPWPKFHLGRVLALEGLVFLLLTLMAILGGFSLDNAEKGQDGGVIGWGLAELLDRAVPLPWSTLLVIFLMVLFASYGTGGIQWALRKIEKWLDTVNPAGAAYPSQAKAAQEIQKEKVTHSLAQTRPTPELTPEPKSDIRNPALPPLDLFLDEKMESPDEKYIQEAADRIEHTLAEFGVPARVKGYRVGPTVTQFAVEPGFVEKPGPDGEIIRQKVRVSQISALSRDLALALSAERLRIEAPVPGQSYVGIEVPNQRSSIVRMRSLLESDDFTRLSSPLAIVLGRDVSGQPVVADLARMPHLLIAGTTGSGKSVCIATIATTLAANNTPADLRMALLDPKMVELVRFNGLPHLYGKVETELERMLAVLRWALAEMDHRYKLLEEARARDLEVYNRRMEKRGQPKLPRIVIIIDELADLMMTAPDQTEHSLIRLAQMARAVGIHLVVATQRPSTDVVTGLIKANFPARLAFTVASAVDSRVILDNNGAETLLGRGDMLFLNPESGTPLRAQGAWVSDQELEAVISHWHMQSQDQPKDPAPWESLLESGDEEDGDALVEQAIKIVRRTQRASASLLQRRLRVGYPRAARLMDELEELGVVGPGQGGGREREVLLPPEDDEEGEDYDE